MASENVELLRGVYERWGRGDFKTEAVYDDDFSVTLGPEFPDAGVHHGRDGVAAYTKSFLEPWERITIKAEEMIDGQDKVLVRVLQQGTGELSGVGVELRYFMLWTFAGGRPMRLESIMHEAEARAKLESPPAG